jgi:hypothetical protein
MTGLKQNFGLKVSAAMLGPNRGNRSHKLKRGLILALLEHGPGEQNACLAIGWIGVDPIEQRLVRQFLGECLERWPLRDGHARQQRKTAKKS